VGGISCIDAVQSPHPDSGMIKKARDSGNVVQGVRAIPSVEKSRCESRVTTEL
jgi:hypothetical protein